MKGEKNGANMEKVMRARQEEISQSPNHKKKSWEEKQEERDKKYREREEEREKKQKERDEKREKEMQDRDEEKRKSDLSRTIGDFSKSKKLDPLLDGNPIPALGGFCKIALKCKLRPLPGAKSAQEIAAGLKKIEDRALGREDENEQGISPEPWRR